MKRLIHLILGMTVSLLSLQARATIILSLEPTPQTINVGEPVSFNLVVSGLGDLSSPSLGGFNFDRSYDPGILSATSVLFGNQLGLGTQFSDLSTPGSIHFDEVSFESPGDLTTNQPSSFTLATLGFANIGPGISVIGFSFGSPVEPDD